MLDTNLTIEQIQSRRCMRLWDLKKKIAKLQEYDLFNSKK